MVDMVSLDVFRIATLRAPQPSAAAGALQIAIRDEGVEHGWDDRVRVNVIDGFVLDRIDHPWLEDQPKLVSFNQWLTARRDLATPDEIASWYRRETNFKLDELVVSEWFDQTELVVHASLLAFLARRPAQNEATTVSRGRHDMLRAARLIGLLRELARADTILETAEDVALYLSACPIVVPAWFGRPVDRLARPPLIADLKVVKLASPHYEPGGILYVENIMSGEKRSREVRRVEELEITRLDEAEETTDRSDELATTSTSQLTQEVSKTLQEQENTEVGVNVSAQYGPYVKVDANAKYGRQSSRNEATRAAATFSNQVMKRATERVIERHLSRTTTRQLLRTEELNSHSFENPAEEPNAVGVYRSVETVQASWIENYGQRLMLEFMIPEPAAFVRWIESQPKPAENGLRAEPQLPQAGGQPLTAQLIDENNYLALVSAVRAAGVVPPPPAAVSIAKTFKGEGDPDLFVLQDSTLTVPDGFRATSWDASLAMWGSGSPDGEVSMISVGGGQPTVLGTPAGLARTASGALDMQQGSVVPVILLGRGLINFSASVRVDCVRTDAALAKWRLGVYDAIVLAWRKDHDDWAAERARMDSDAALAAVVELGAARSPEQNRVIERRELRRGVLTFLTGEPLDQGVFAGQAVTVDPALGPSIDFEVSLEEADWIAFLEQGFEWQNMTWVHYPYYWADAGRWKTDALRADSDPLWNAFVTAGSTRVVVPVRPGFEPAICWYLATGIIWDGGDAPTLGDPMYVGIADELAESLGAAGPAVLDRHDLDAVRLPTTLVWLQPTGELNPVP